MLAGVIHDIGAFYILSRMGAHPELFDDRDSVGEIVDDWHTAIGHAILEEWGFPQAVTDAVDEHESVERTHVGRADLTDVVMVANLLAHADKPSRKARQSRRRFLRWSACS